MSKKRDTDPGFLRWWNDNCLAFSNDPFYRTFEKLHAAGANLDYLNFIRRLFEFGAEEFDPIVQRSTLRRARRRMKKTLVKGRAATDVIARQIERLHSIIEGREIKSNSMVLLGELQATQEFLYKVPGSPPPKTVLGIH